MLIQKIKSVAIAAGFALVLTPTFASSPNWSDLEEVGSCHALTSNESEFQECVQIYNRTHGWPEVHIEQQCDVYEGKLINTECILSIHVSMLELEQAVLNDAFRSAMNSRFDRDMFREYLTISRTKLHKLETREAVAARMYLYYVHRFVRIQELHDKFVQHAGENLLHLEFAAEIRSEFSEWRDFYFQICGMILADMDGMCNDVDFHDDFQRERMESGALG